jgi:hypothetical protein
MPIQDYLQPINAGKQIWQMMASNMTSGDHPYNASGVCMALVAQWLMEIKFDPGAAPEVLGRYLLQNDLGTHG